MLNNKICTNLIFMAVIIGSYIGLLVIITNQDISPVKFKLKYGSLDREMITRTIPVKTTEISKIQFGKNLID